MTETQNDLQTLSLAEARAAVAEGRTTAVALAEAHFARIAAEDTELGCYLALSRERALAKAEQVDADARAGRPMGPLAGVPVGIKDVLATRGTETTAGSRILAGWHPPYDATAVTRLEAAGAGGAGQAELRRVCDGVLE